MKLSLGNLKRSVGIDLGGRWVRLWTGGESHVQASCMAVELSSKRVLAIGEEALLMEGRVGNQVEIHNPFENGVVYDWDSGLAFLKILGNKIIKPSVVFSTVGMISVPAGSSLAQREAAARLLKDFGLQEVYTIAQPLVAAIGAGVPIADASGSFIMHMGESLVETGAISLGSLVAYQSSPAAGAFLVKKIQRTIKINKQLIIGRQAAREILAKVASLQVDSKRSMLVTGKDAHTGSPRELTIHASDILPEVESCVTAYQSLIEKMLSDVKPELTVDVIDKGLLLSGGLAQLDGLELFLTQKMGIPVVVVDEPDQCVIKGIADVLEHLDLFRESLGYYVDAA